MMSPSRTSFIRSFKISRSSLVLARSESCASFAFFERDLVLGKRYLRKSSTPR